MKRRIWGAAALAVAGALALAACSTGGSTTASKAVTLKLVVADYGTGPSNTSSKYWQGIATAFHKANPPSKRCRSRTDATAVCNRPARSSPAIGPFGSIAMGKPRLVVCSKHDNG